MTEPWQRVAEQLRKLAALAQAERIDLNAFGSGFAELAEVYYAAVLAAGRSSLRLQAVVKALDLRTPKSALERFVS